MVVSDVILYLFYMGGVMKSALFLTSTAILSRVFLVIFGIENWLFGYMLSYLYFCVILIVLIGKNRFPFEDDFLEINLDKVFKK